MLTDAPPRKHRAEFSESDRIKTLDLPRNGALTEIAQRLESAMKSDKIRDVRSACSEFLATASNFYEVPPCGIRVLAARPLRVRELWATEVFGDYAPQTMLIRVDEDTGSEGDHLLRNVPEHAVPRVLSSSRLPQVRVS